jgi:hypothetical protein
MSEFDKHAGEKVELTDTEAAFKAWWADNGIYHRGSSRPRDELAWSVWRAAWHASRDSAPSADRAARSHVATHTVTDEMVNRFLSWKLPVAFHPDAGISFKRYFNVEYNAKHGKPPQRHEPMGTNLLTATQAREMLEHVLAAAPSATRGSE